MEEGRSKSGATYAKLRVYERSYTAALEVHRRTRGMRAEADLVHQLRRAVRSIPANVAEGVNQSNTATETRRFLGMALRSCDEVRVWLDFCRDLEVLPAGEAERMHREYTEIGAMLYRLWQRWESRTDEEKRGAPSGSDPD